MPRRGCRTRSAGFPADPRGRQVEPECSRSVASPASQALPLGGLRNRPVAGFRHVPACWCVTSSPSTVPTLHQIGIGVKSPSDNAKRPIGSSAARVLVSRCGGDPVPARGDCVRWRGLACDVTAGDPAPRTGRGSALSAGSCGAGCGFLGQARGAVGGRARRRVSRSREARGASGVPVSRVLGRLPGVWQQGGGLADHVRFGARTRVDPDFAGRLGGVDPTDEPALPSRGNAPGPSPATG